jgi:hypothetical protein
MVALFVLPPLLKAVLTSIYNQVTVCLGISESLRLGISKPRK